MRKVLALALALIMVMSMLVTVSVVVSADNFESKTVTKTATFDVTYLDSTSYTANLSILGEEEKKPYILRTHVDANTPATTYDASTGEVTLDRTLGKGLITWW